MRITDGVIWGPADFIIAGALEINSGVLGVFVLNSFFALMFIGSAFPFHRASAETKMSPRK